MNTPDEIYLMETGDGVLWCKDSAPGADMDPEDSVKYIRAGSLDESHPKFEALVRAFWRRIDGYKNDHGKELPSPLPVEFRAHMATALSVFR